MSRFITFALLLLSFPVFGQQLSDVADTLAPHEDGPGGVVAIIENGEIIDITTAGFANVEHRIPFTAETRTNIGSTSKQFTAYGILLLAEEGKLSLGDDVREYIPELPGFEHTVTIEHLLTHTSGYREFLNSLLIEGRQLMAGDVVYSHEIIDIVKRQPALQSVPGEVFNYNNTGYALLATIIERVSEEDFEDWMRENVFLPAGMTETIVVGGDRRALLNSAQGYVRNPEDGAYYHVPDIPASTGAGGIYTTPGDLARWMKFIFSDEQRDIFVEMTTGRILMDGDSIHYGYGLMIHSHNEYVQIEHGGADAAHLSTFVFYPELNTGVIILTNHNGVSGSIYNDALSIIFPETEEDSVAEELAPELLSDGDVLDDYIGEFALDAAPGFVLTFTREDDELIGQGSGQPPFATVATSDSTFTIVGVDAALTFHREADGSVNHLTLHQNGNHRATRKASEKSPSWNAADFVGRYFSVEAETFYEIVQDEEGIAIDHRRFADPLELTYSQEDTFSSMATGFILNFERDDDGNVTGFYVNFGRTTDVWFEKL